MDYLGQALFDVFVNMDRIEKVTHKNKRKLSDEELRNIRAQLTAREDEIVKIIHLIDTELDKR